MASGALAVGGFDEERLPVIFNDVDLCLKMQRAGYLIVYTPFAKLYHHESATRRRLASLHRLWCERQRSDQYFGTLVNAYLSQGGAARGIKRGDTYVDVGTMHGYREAVRLLSSSQIAA